MEPHLAKPLLLALYKDQRLPGAVYSRLEGAYRKIDYKGTAHPFTATSYYEPEFGTGLYRHLISFSGLMDPWELPSLKHLMYTMERKYIENEKRTINLDIGYLDTDKLVLASFKRGRNKLYMGNSVYADMQMEYAKGIFTAMPWAFIDVKQGLYNQDLTVVREKLKSEMKKSQS